MCDKRYEIHINDRKNSCPEFYVIDRRTGERFANWQWPPELEQLGCDYVNENSEFVVDYGYDPEYVKCYFVDTRNILGVMNIFVELTEAGEEFEMRKYREKCMYDIRGYYRRPTFYHPKEK